MKHLAYFLIGETYSVPWNLAARELVIFSFPAFTVWEDKIEVEVNAEHTNLWFPSNGGWISFPNESLPEKGREEKGKMTI